MSCTTGLRPAAAATSVTRSFDGTAFAAIGSVLDPNCLHGVANVASLTLSRPSRPDWHASFQGCNQMIAKNIVGFGGPLTMSTPRPTHILGSGAIIFDSSTRQFTGVINISGSDGEYVSGQIIISFGSGPPIRGQAKGTVVVAQR